GGGGRPVGEVAGGFPGAAAAVDVEEVEVLHIQDDRHQAQPVGVAGPLLLLPAGLAEQQVVDVEQEARLGAAAGDAVDVEVAAVSAEQVIEVDAAGAGEAAAAGLDQADRERGLDLVGGISHAGVGLAAEEDVAACQRRGEDRRVGAQDGDGGVGEAGGVERRLVGDIAVVAVEALADVGFAALAVDLADQAVEPQLPVADAALRADDLRL